MKPKSKTPQLVAVAGHLVRAARDDATLAEQVYVALRADIISGAIPAGQALRLELLKDRYGASFSPIREALNRLQSERLVAPLSSRGFQVAPLSETEMWDAIEVRVLIDSQALRLSIARADDAWEVRLVGAYHALMLATSSRATDAPRSPVEEEEHLESRHLEFHQSLIAGCGSPRLIDLSAQLYAQTERYRRPSLRGQRRGGGTRNVDGEHRDLLTAAVARDADRATTLLAQHYRETGHLIAKLLAAAPAP